MRSATRFFAALAFLAAALPAAAQSPTRADILRGEYGRYRANNDLLSYHLDIRVDPAKRLLSGRNTIRFRMLSDDTRIQIDLYEYLAVEKILLGSRALTYTREMNAVVIDFHRQLILDGQIVEDLRSILDRARSKVSERRRGDLRSGRMSQLEEPRLDRA